ncbi:MAG: response regulator transcription factor [Lachnospiraceae bacterium]|nr:response regulator transcription factor [Lachnospiraceae bacterium]
MKHILIIDDDVYIGNVLEETLSKEGYQVSRAYSGTEALYVLSASKPDLILLDLMLPGLSGEEVLPQIKGIPVIVVSAKIDVDDKVDLLLGGAADYITKPFEMKELLARITVALRNGSVLVNSILSFDDLRLDITTHEVFVGQQGVNLTRTEYAILKILMQNPSQVIAKSVLLERITEDTPDCTDNSLKTHISHLRKKLRDIGGKEYIDAVWGIGFKLKSE